METVKNKVFNYLTNSQKSEICHYISLFVKKHSGKTTDEILSLFIEEEKYYLEINSSRHPWIVDYIDNEEFNRDSILYIKENQRKYKYRESQKVYTEKQKDYQKEQRKIIRDRKMSKLPPTPNQIAYYKALCRKYGIEVNSIDLEKASRLDLGNAIDGLLKEEHKSDKQAVLSKLNEIIQSRL